MADWMTLAEAITANVHDGDTLAMEGFTHLIPFAGGHEIIRQRLRNLALVRMTPDLIYDQLIGAGCVKKLIASWVGNVAAGLGHNYRRAAENGGHRRVAAVLAQLEPLLKEVADTPGSSDLQAAKRHIENEDLLFKVRIARNNLKELS